MKQVAYSKPNINDLLKHLGDFDFEVNEWGSCQYSGALAMYKAYFKLKEKGVLDFLRFEYGYDVSFSGVRDDENAIDMYFKILAHKRNWDFDLYDYDETEKLDERWQKTVWGIRRAQSADDLFFIGRNASSDLWHTAPHVAESYFIGLEMKNMPDCDNQTGLERGPVGNLCAQSDNVKTGLCCALLKDYGLVKNERSFRGFDT